MVDIFSMFVCPDWKIIVHFSPSPISMFCFLALLNLKTLLVIFIAGHVVTFFQSEFWEKHLNIRNSIKCNSKWNVENCISYKRKFKIKNWRKNIQKFELHSFTYLFILYFIYLICYFSNLNIFHLIKIVFIILFSFLANCFTKWNNWI